eukprot:29496-Pelagococcus_subviridis.AAC.2
MNRGGEDEEGGKRAARTRWETLDAERRGQSDELVQLLGGERILRARAREGRGGRGGAVSRRVVAMAKCGRASILRWPGRTRVLSRARRTCVLDLTRCDSSFSNISARTFAFDAMAAIAGRRAVDPRECARPLNDRR